MPSNVECYIAAIDLCVLTDSVVSAIDSAQGALRISMGSMLTGAQKEIAYANEAHARRDATELIDVLNSLVQTSDACGVGSDRLRTGMSDLALLFRQSATKPPKERFNDLLEAKSILRRLPTLQRQAVRQEQAA